MTSSNFDKPQAQYPEFYKNKYQGIEQGKNNPINLSNTNEMQENINYFGNDGSIDIADSLPTCNKRALDIDAVIAESQSKFSPYSTYKKQEPEQSKTVIDDGSWLPSFNIDDLNSKPLKKGPSAEDVFGVDYTPFNVEEPIQEQPVQQPVVEQPKTKEFKVRVFDAGDDGEDKNDVFNLYIDDKVVAKNGDLVDPKTCKDPKQFSGYEDSAYVDLDITSGEHVFKVHGIDACESSDSFHFQESDRTNRISSKLGLQVTDPNNQMIFSKTSGLMINKDATFAEDPSIQDPKGTSVFNVKVQ